MRCVNCGAEQSDSARFCGECGSQLPRADGGPLSGNPRPAPSPPSPGQTEWRPPVTQSSAYPAPPPTSVPSYEMMRRVNAEAKSFTTPAVITLVLYMVLWLPGLIANIVYLNEANSVRRISGREPEGRGCLIALLTFFVGVPVLGLCLLFGIGVLGSAGS